MKAMVYRGYGSPAVLRLDELDDPVPRSRELLVRVLASSVNAIDAHLLLGKPDAGEPGPEHADALRTLLEGGEVVPEIERSYPLEGLPEALAYLETGHSRAKLVITL